MANDNTINISISSDVASKLFLAYVGLSPVRRDAVDKSVKDDKISRQQATLNEICNPRVLMYAKRGEEAQLEIMQQAKAVLMAQGIPEAQASKMLGLGE